MAACAICIRYPHNDDVFPIKMLRDVISIPLDFYRSNLFQPFDLQALFGGFFFLLAIEYVAEISLKEVQVHIACPMQGLAFFH